MLNLRKYFLKNWRFMGVCFFVSMAFLSCTDAKTDHSPLEKAPFVNMQRLEGKWYVGSRIPTWFDKDAQNVSIDFKIKDLTSFDLKWSYSAPKNKDLAPKESESVSGKASSLDAELTSVETVRNTETWELTGKAGKGKESGHWRIYPLGPFYMNLQVIEFSGDYSWIVVGSKDRRWAWVLTREENVGPELMGGIKARLEEFKFDVAALKFKDSNSGF